MVLHLAAQQKQQVKQVKSTSEQWYTNSALKKAHEVCSFMSRFEFDGRIPDSTCTSVKDHLI